MRVRRATESDVELLVALNAWVHELHVDHDPGTYRATEPDTVLERPSSAEGAAAGRAWGARMDLASARAVALGCARLVLDVAAFNAGALAFYEALGFTASFHRLTREVP